MGVRLGWIGVWETGYAGVLMAMGCNQLAGGVLLCLLACKLGLCANGAAFVWSGRLAAPLTYFCFSRGPGQHKIVRSFSLSALIVHFTALTRSYDLYEQHFYERPIHDASSLLLSQLTRRYVCLCTSCLFVDGLGDYNHDSKPQ